MAGTREAEELSKLLKDLGLAQFNSALSRHGYGSVDACLVSGSNDMVLFVIISVDHLAPCGSVRLPFR